MKLHLVDFTDRRDKKKHTADQVTIETADGKFCIFLNEEKELQIRKIFGFNNSAQINVRPHSSNNIIIK